MLDKSIKENLSAAYKILAMLGMDDHTYTHLSARSMSNDSFFIYPFGHLFYETEADSLLEVSLDGRVIQGIEYQYNKTGFIIHGSIYKARPDIRAIFHLHTPASVAVSATESGLLPLSQWALHFYERLSYHPYNSLALDDKHSNNLASDLASNYAMLMHHHGMLTAGKTIHEAMFYAYHLEQACKTQCLIGCNKTYKIDPIIAQQTVQDIYAFEQDLGARDWQAWLRILKNN